MRDPSPEAAAASEEGAPGQELTLESDIPSLDVEVSADPQQDATPTTPVREAPNSEQNAPPPTTPKDPASSSSSSPSSPTMTRLNGEASPGAAQRRRDSLRRKSSKIANLRAAFERNDPPPPSLSETGSKPRRFEKLPPNKAQEYLHALKAQLLQETQLRQAYEERCTSLEEGLAEMSMRLEDREAELAQSQREELKRRSKGFQVQRDAAAAEAQLARQQLCDLKRSLATATRVESFVVTDSTFVAEVGRLDYEVQNFVVNSFRRAKGDLPAAEMVERLGKVEGSSGLAAVMQNYESSAKISILQAVVAFYFMDIFKDPLLFGLPSDVAWLDSIRTAAVELPNVLTAVDFNKWRAVTLDSIRQSAAIQESVEHATRQKAETACTALNAITETEASSARVDSLTAILRRAVSLAHQFRVQRAQYEFLLPAPDTPFDPEAMEDMSTDDGEPAEGRVVRCSVFPSVVKRGDEDGDHVGSLANVVVKARVLCYK